MEQTNRPMYSELFNHNINVRITRTALNDKRVGENAKCLSQTTLVDCKPCNNLNYDSGENLFVKYL